MSSPIYDWYKYPTNLTPDTVPLKTNYMNYFIYDKEWKKNIQTILQGSPLSVMYLFLFDLYLGFPKQYLTKPLYPGLAVFYAKIPNRFPKNILFKYIFWWSFSISISTVLVATAIFKFNLIQYTRTVEKTINSIFQKCFWYNMHLQYYVRYKYI